MNRRPACVKKKDWHSSKTQRSIMEDGSSTHSFLNPHHHRHHASFHLTLPSLQSPEVGYQSPQFALDSLEQYGSRGEESLTPVPNSSTSSAGRRGSSGGFLNTLGSGLDGQLDRESGLGGHFTNNWYGGIKKEEVWEDGESCESGAGDFYGKSGCYGDASDVLFGRDCGSEDGVNHRVRANYTSYPQPDTAYSREADAHFTRQTSSYSGNQGSVSFCRTEPRVGDGYSGREEDFGSSSGSGEEQLHPAEAEQGSWLSYSPLSQSGDGRWRGAPDPLALTPLPQKPPVGLDDGAYTQKLDSFSEAFLSQRKRRFPLIPSGDSPGQFWEFGAGKGEIPGLIKSRLSCALDADSYPPPPSSSPVHLSLPSFPSPPTSSHLMSSVLSPPPTPLPPPSHSPSKMDSPGGFGGAGHSGSQGAEALGALQFFASRLQPLPSVHSSGMIWKFPLLSHCFPQMSDDPSSNEGNLRSSHGGDYGNITASIDLQSPESSSHRTSLQPSRDFCSSNSPSLHPSFQLPTHPSRHSDPHPEVAKKATPYMVTQKVKHGSVSLSHSQIQIQQPPPIYTGMQFPSILQSSRGHREGHYTPPPLLNPVRRGPGLYSSLSVLHREDEVPCGTQEEECGVSPWVNVGRDFQAELPPCTTESHRSEVWSPEDESPREQLLWKPWDELEESTKLQDQVEQLLSMCSSSCLPGGGSNMELAVHCLHYCQGNTMATLEMLLFSQPSPTGNYHYSGSDLWTDNEKNVFSAALGTYGKNFSLIQKMVKTKSVCQCVEFYYLSKKLLDKQKKQKEEECRDGETDQQKSATPISQPVDRQFGREELVPAPSLVSFFPCKLCGKMFYKIKSRNAHMKIHRQPQEDWTDRRLQHQLLTQRLALNHASNLTPTPGGNLLPPQAPALSFPSSGLPGMSNNTNNADNVLNSVSSSNTIAPGSSAVLDPSSPVTYSNVAPNSHVILSIDAADSSQREPATVLPFHQSWGSFGPSPNPAAFYCTPEGKQAVGAKTGGVKVEPINWQ